MILGPVIFSIYGQFKSNEPLDNTDPFDAPLRIHCENLQFPTDLCYLWKHGIATYVSYSVSMAPLGYPYGSDYESVEGNN